MGKNRQMNSHESVSYKISHGYGRGAGLDYKATFSGHEFASEGKYIRLMGITVPRQYYFMSQLEADAFLYYDSLEDVSDIQEQYRLSLEETLEICDLLHIKHPFSGTYYNLVTTDLLICKGGAWIARAIKSVRDLANQRVTDKLEIERVYFSRRGIEWKIITEKDLNRDCIENINWLRSGELPKILASSPSLLQEASSLFCQMYEDNVLFPSILDEITAQFQLPDGGAVNLFKYLILHHRLHFDMERPRNMFNPREPFERSAPDERYRSYC